jgi:hypothetical protein
MDPPERGVPIEEGVNAASAAASALRRGWRAVPGDAPGPAPLELSSAQVKDQIRLIAKGLIGRGGLGPGLNWGAPAPLPAGSA